MSDDKQRASHSALLAGFALLASQLSLNAGAAVAKYLFPLIGVEGVTAYRVGFAALLMMLVFRPWRTRLTWAATCPRSRSRTT